MLLARLLLEQLKTQRLKNLITILKSLNFNYALSDKYKIYSKEDYLKEKKYNIYLCDDFSSANEILQYFLFDLVIIDRMMPSGDGIDLIKVIKEKEVLSNSPIF